MKRLTVDFWSCVTKITKIILKETGLRTWIGFLWHTRTKISELLWIL